jgi:Tol biopolymer transport system component
VSPDGKLVAYVGLGKQGNRIWLVGPDGKGLRDPYRTGLQTAPSFSPDGQTLYFAFPMAPWLSPPDPAQYGVWKATVEGGRPERITPDPADDAVVSPDGRLIAYRTSVSGDPEVRVIPVAGGEPVAHILMPETGPIGWTPDSEEIVWARNESGVANLWAHSIAHTTQRQVTRFAAPGEIYGFAWSRDGKWIAVSRGRPRSDVVMFNDQSWW